MKRRDSLASLFTGHSSKILSGGDQELLSDGEDVEKDSHHLKSQTELHSLTILQRSAALLCLMKTQEMN